MTTGKLLLSFFAIVIFLLPVQAQKNKDFPYYHDWEIIPLSLNLYTGTENSYKADLMQVRVSYFDLGIYSILSHPNQTGDNESFFNSKKLDYAFPVGINIPVRQDKNMQWSILSTFYWTRTPYAFETEFRMEYRFFSVMTGYRYIDYVPDSKSIFYAGVSFGYHHFFNRRKVSSQKRIEIQNALGSTNTDNLFYLDFTKKGYLDIMANLRQGTEYNSTLTFLEETNPGKSYYDSLCLSRSIEILRDLKSKAEINGIKGVQVTLNYGGFTPETRYDYGASNVPRVPDLGPYPNKENTYFGASKKYLVLEPDILFSLKMNLNDFNSNLLHQEPLEIIQKCITENKVENYLELNHKVKY